VFHNGHDIDRYASPSANARSRIRREFALADDRALVGVVGRLHIAQKGQDVMIRALPALQERCPGVALLLVGDGPDRARCEALVSQLGLVHAVRFCGRRDDIPDLLAAVDVVAVPSICEEALPLVALEACAAGRPVVAFESGGLPEVVLHRETGIIVPKGDVGRLSEAIATLLEDPELASGLGEAGRRHAARFGLSRHVSELTDFYDAVLEEHRQSKYRSSGAWREKPTC
jgi:glycosyltransferase involved in cell wall biosynthesis